MQNLPAILKRTALVALWLACWGGVGHAQDSLDGGSWSGKITATADAPGGSLTDFFYVVQVDSSQTQFWSAVQNDGDDVRAKVDGSQVPCWVDPDTFNYAGQSCLVYVMRSGSSSSAPAIDIYFGNAGASKPSASATYGQNNTFPTSLKAFYPRGGGNDVTSNANHLTMTGSPTVGGVSGPISGSLATDYNGSSQYGVATASVPTGVPLFIGVTLFPDSINRTQDMIGVSYGSATFNADLFGCNLNSANAIRASASRTNFASATVGTASVSSWQSMGAAFASTTNRVAYLNGSAGSAETTSVTPANINNICVGISSVPRLSVVDGKIAFARVYTSALSATHEAYWHAMLADPDQSDFYNGWTYSAVSGGGGGKGLLPLFFRLQLSKAKYQADHFATYGVYALAP